MSKYQTKISFGDTIDHIYDGKQGKHSSLSSPNHQNQQHQLQSRDAKPKDGVGRGEKQENNNKLKQSSKRSTSSSSSSSSSLLSPVTPATPTTTTTPISSSPISSLPKNDTDNVSKFSVIDLNQLNQYRRHRPRPGPGNSSKVVDDNNSTKNFATVSIIATVYEPLPQVVAAQKEAEKETSIVSTDSMASYDRPYYNNGNLMASSSSISKQRTLDDTKSKIGNFDDYYGDDERISDHEWIHLCSIPLYHSLPVVRSTLLQSSSSSGDESSQLKHRTLPSPIGFVWFYNSNWNICKLYRVYVHRWYLAIRSNWQELRSLGFAPNWHTNESLLNSDNNSDDQRRQLQSKLFLFDSNLISKKDRGKFPMDIADFGGGGGGGGGDDHKNDVVDDGKELTQTFLMSNDTNYDQLIEVFGL